LKGAYTLKETHEPGTVPSKKDDGKKPPLPRGLLKKKKEERKKKKALNWRQGGTNLSGACLKRG